MRISQKVQWEEVEANRYWHDMFFPCFQLCACIKWPIYLFSDVNHSLLSLKRMF